MARSAVVLSLVAMLAAAAPLFSQSDHERVGVERIDGPVVTTSLELGVLPTTTQGGDASASGHAALRQSLLIAKRYELSLGTTAAGRLAWDREGASAWEFSVVQLRAAAAVRLGAGATRGKVGGGVQVGAANAWAPPEQRPIHVSASTQLTRISDPCVVAFHLEASALLDSAGFGFAELLFPELGVAEISLRGGMALVEVLSDRLSVSYSASLEASMFPKPAFSPPALSFALIRAMQPFSAGVGISRSSFGAVELNMEISHEKRF